VPEGDASRTYFWPRLIFRLQVGSSIAAPRRSLS
jgi:hypothetical protein